MNLSDSGLVISAMRVGSGGASLEREKALRVTGGPFREPEGSCLCEKENFGPSEWPQSDDLPDYFFFFAVVFFLAGAFFLALEALFVAFFFIAICASLLRSVTRSGPSHHRHFPHQPPTTHTGRIIWGPYRVVNGRIPF